MVYKVVSTETFSKEFKKYKKNKEFVNALDKKIKRLKQEPHNVGGFLSGKLKGYKSARIIRKYRLLFKIIEHEKKVFLIAIDHRKFNYERF